MTPAQTDNNLRHRAEEQLKTTETAISNDLSPVEMQQLLYELRVHQIELEMQNEELRRTQHELELSRSSYFNLYDLAPVGYLAVSEHGLIQNANLAAASLLGVVRTEILNKPLTSFIVPDDQDIYYHYRKNIIKGEELEGIELRIVCPGNSPRWVYLHAKGGKDGEFLINLTDISKRKQTELALEYLSLYNRSLFECSLDPIFAINNKGKIFDVNSAAEKVTGYSCRELIDTNYADYFTDPVTVEKRCQRVFKDGLSKDCELDIRHRDGRIFTVLCNASVIHDDTGKVCGIVASIRDVSQRKQSEKYLKNKNDELEVRVLERTSEMLATVVTLRNEVAERERAETRLTRLNKIYSVIGEIDQAIIRASDKESLFQDFCKIAVEQGGFLLAWVGGIDEESGLLHRVTSYGATGYLDNITITASVGLALSGPIGMAIHKGTHYICNDFLNDPITKPWHEQGREHGIRSSACVVVKEEGRVIGALSLYAGEIDFYDHDNAKLLIKMGADISFALDNLARGTSCLKAEHLLRVETVERLRAVEALRKKEQLLIQQSRLAAMGEMINNIAHQWRQPLNNVALHVQGLALFYDTEMFDKNFLDSTVEDIMDLINHMSLTIDDFRNFFKPDKEKIDFNVNQYIRQSINLVEDSFKSNHLNVILQSADEVSLFGYPNEFSQVILNILQNARDALLEHNVSDGQVVIVSSIENGKVVVTITDNAGGIPVNIIDKIFEPYFSTKGLQGTGIGLHMSKNIIETNLGGRLTVSNRDQGAEFRIEI